MQVDKDIVILKSKTIIGCKELHDLMKSFSHATSVWTEETFLMGKVFTLTVKESALRHPEIVIALKKKIVNAIANMVIEFLKH